MRMLAMLARALFASVAAWWDAPAPIVRMGQLHGPSTSDKPVHDRRTSRYMPHQGKQEMARRRLQMAKIGVRRGLISKLACERIVAGQI